jgi:tryptophan-rich sensory protein
MPWSLIVLVGIGLVATVGFACMPLRVTLPMVPIGVVIAVGFAFTPISYLGQALVLGAVLGLVVRAVAYVARCFRDHRTAMRSA